MTTDYENETSVIGAILIEPSCYPEVSKILTADDFQYEQPRDVFEVVTEMSVGGEPIDPVTIADRLKKRHSAAGKEYLVEAMEVTPTAANVIAYANLVKEASNKRKLAGLAMEIHKMLADLSSADEIAAKVYDRLASLEKKSGTVTSADAMIEFMTHREHIDNGRAAFIRTGYSQLDRLLGGGMANGGVYVVGSRPGMGKTSFGLNVTENVASAGNPCLFVSLEMTRIELTAKRIARDSGLTYSDVLMSKLGTEHYRRMMHSMARLAELPVTITDKPIMSVADIALEARRIKGLKLLCIDYFSLIKPPTKRQKRYEEMSEISGELKMLAKSLDIPILLLAQLNRENESRSNKRPILSDLRETGALEQDATAVMFLHREGYYAHKTEDDNGHDWESEELEVIVAKNRNGKTGVVPMLWFGNSGRIHVIEMRY